METKYCKHCGELIDYDCIICPKCGKQVEKLESANSNPTIVVNNSAVSNSNATATAINAPIVGGRPKNKWISFFLCLFTIFGHKIYEGKIGMAILYFFTGGLFCIGWIIDLVVILTKPNPYYV